MMSKVVLLNKETDNDPVTGTPIKNLAFSWSSYYGQAKSHEGRFYQLLVPHHEDDHPGKENFKKMEQDPNLVMTRDGDESLI